MSRADAERWDRKYRERAHPAPGEPSRVLVEHGESLRGPGRALDVACGAGANAIWLARRGYTVLGVDASVAGLRIARAAADAAGLDVALLAADLDAWRPPPGAFDAVVVVRFLSRPLLPALAAALAPGGALFYATFNRLHLERHPRFDPDYVLAPGELVASFADALEIVATNDSASIDEPLTWLLARRRAPA